MVMFLLKLIKTVLHLEHTKSLVTVRGVCFSKRRYSLYILAVVKMVSIISL